jgi:diguanylate cyclase (GGDEF)-like protein
VSSDRPVTTAREPARVPSARAGSATPGSVPADLAGFEILAELGRGAQSTVYRVLRPGETGSTQYALKILDRALTDSDGALAAFHREAALMASVDHPGLTRVHEVGVAEGRPYLVMDLVDGISLADVLAAGAMPVDQVVALALDLVDPLAAVHRKGLVHRDLKPPNIMVLADGEARLIDFGLTTRGGVSDSAVTVGTLAYSAPEQSGMLKRPVDNRSDLYSLGVILFEALTGELPFASSDVGELLRMHAVRTAPDLADLIPGLPRELADIVATLLAKDPDDRYQSGELLAADLRALAGGDARAAERAPARPRESTLTGRNTELALLSERWAQARGGHGGVCVVRGPAGSGKSSLTGEVAELVQADGGIVLRAVTSSDDPVPFGPLRAALDGYLHAVGRMPVKDRWKQRARIRAACAGWSHEMLSRLAPGIELILNGREVATAPAAASEAPEGSEVADGLNQFAASVAGFLLGLARESGSLLLLLDDVHWLDPGSRRVLAHLRDELATTPLLVLATTRDDEASQAGTDEFVAALGSGGDLDLTLGPLDEAAVAAQIQSMMPGLGTHAQLVKMLHVRSNGNPFIVQEYLRAINDAGLLRPSWGSWILDDEGLDALELPQDAVGLVLARVQGLGDDSRELLTAAAAIGTRFRPETVAAVLELDVDAVLAALAEATRRGLVESRDSAEFGFLHDRIREALLADLDPDGLADLHRRIAEALDALPVPPGLAGAQHVYAVAQHYMRCAPGVAVEPAFAACSKAGRLALENHAPGEAVTFLIHAADVGNRTPSGFLLLLGTALQQAGRLAEARERLEQALQTETTLTRRAEIFTLLAGVYRSNWNTGAALDAIDRGLAELGAKLPDNRVMLWLSTALMFATAVFRQWTRIGFGSATGLRREHSAAIAGLHEVGTYVGVISMRPDLVLVHDLRALYWTTQLGPGRRFALSQGSFGMIAGVLGRRRTARRAFARAEADPAAELPAVRATIAHYRGAAAFLGRHDNAQSWIRSTEADGQWMDVASYLDAVSLFNVYAVAQGRTREAEYWLAQGRRRLGGLEDDVTSFIGCAPMTHALLGRFGEAGTELRRMTELCQGNPAAGMQAVRLLATTFVLAEQGELGKPFEEAVAEFEALALPVRRMIRTHRLIHFEIALGRLAQVRVADPVTRPTRLAQARRAVEAAEQSAQAEEVSARARLVRANLLILEEQPDAALAVLAAIPLFTVPDAPTIAFELARARARALTLLGADEGRRQARQAASIALDQHWPHRAAAVAVEFGLSPAERGTASLPVSQAGTYAGGLERQRLQALQQVSAAASRVLDPGELARVVLDETIRILAADRAFLFLADGESGGLEPHLGRDNTGQDVPELTGYSTSLVERVRVSGQPLVMTGTEEGAALGAESVVLHGLRSILVAPLLLEGRVLGVVYLDSQVAKGIFTADDVGILTALTNHIATSLETARAAQLEISVQTAQRQRDLADTLRRTLQSMSDTFDPEEVVIRMLASARRVLGCDGAWLMSFDEETDSDGFRIMIDPENGELVRIPVPVDQALIDLAEQIKPVVGTPAMVPEALEQELALSTSWISVPMQIRSGKIGSLVLSSDQPQASLGEMAEVAAVLGAQGMTAYEKSVLFKKVEELSVADELTGIANRRRFFEVATRDLAAAARHKRPLTALMVDIDHFKRVNDGYGHATGDDVIRIVASRLRAQVRQTDILGRYGGEEFALLLQDAGPGNDLPERLRACIADEQIETRTGPMAITVSIGLAYLSEEDENISHFLARADAALYRAKNEGRNRVCEA